MDPCCYQRQEKYRQDLRSNGLLDFVVTHAYILQDHKSLFVLIAFGDLFVVHDQYGCHQEQDPQENAYKEQPREHAAKTVHFAGSAFQDPVESLIAGIFIRLVDLVPGFVVGG